MSQCHNVTMSHMQYARNSGSLEITDVSWPQASERPALDLESDAIL